MAKVEDITGLRAVNQSVTTGKRWSSGDNMASEVSANDRKYFGGVYAVELQLQRYEVKKMLNFTVCKSTDYLVIRSNTNKIKCVDKLYNVKK